MKKLALAATAAFSLTTLLAACSTTEGGLLRESTRNLRNPAPCPNIVVLNNANRKVSFAGEQELSNITYTAEIADVKTTCRYVKGEPIEASLEVVIDAGKGPMAAQNSTNVGYFVAITRTNKDLIVKENYTVPVNFGNRDVVRVRDSINQIIIPRNNDNISGVNFEIIVGLQVTPDEFRFNRSGKSLKFPNL